MAATAGTSGFGTLLQVGDGTSSESFTTIAEVTNISGPSESLETIDATHMESPSSYREYIPSLLDSGDISFDVNFLPGNATQTGLRTDMQARTLRNFQMVFTDSAASQYSFSAYVTGFEISAQIDDKLSASITLKVTGPVVLS